MRLTRAVAVALPVLGFLGAAVQPVVPAAATAAAAEARPYHELAAEPRALALTPGLEGRRLGDVLDRLERAGVRVPVAVAGAGLVVVDEPGLDARLAAESITRVHRDPLPAGELREAGGPAAALREWWEAGFRGSRVSAAEEQRVARAAERHEICAGVRRIEDVVDRSACGPNGFGKVHFAAGRCVVNLILPESVGASSTHDWDGGQIALVGAELVRALDWWATNAFHGANFVLVDHGPQPTTEEPAALGITNEALYMEDCLGAMGYAQSSCAYQQVDDLNEAMKVRHGAQWAFTQFVLNADTFPGSGALAYAYLGGPHTVALRGNGSLGLAYLDRTLIHEIGHIFQAADEYSSGCGCSTNSFWGYLDVPNANCVDCPTQVDRCVMRGSGEYSASEMQNLETVVKPCVYTRQMAGIHDGDGDGIWDVRETYPETILTADLPDTVSDIATFRLAGRTWDTPYPADPRKYPVPVTVNRIRGVEFRIDGGPVRFAQPKDGLFTELEEDFEGTLPRLGGGPHLLTAYGINTVGLTDPTPVTEPFFVYDVKLLRDEIEVLQEGARLYVQWRVDGFDFGSTYRLWRKAGAHAPEVLAAEIPSRDVRNEEFSHADADVEPGVEYIYRLEVDIPGKGVKELGIQRRQLQLVEPPPGKIASFGPNPSRGPLLISVTVPRGPRPNQGDLLIPEDGAAGFRGDDDTPIWRDVVLQVYDVRGRLVRDLGIFRQQEAARFSASWDGKYRDGSPAPTGVYFLRIALDYQETMEKLVLVR